jgi:phage-related protein
MATSAQISFAFIAKDAASKTIRGLSSTVSGLGKVSSRVGGFLKTGFKAALVGIGGAIAGATAALYKFTQAAIADEKSNAKLVSVLKSRKLASAENLAIVEKLITQGAALAFTGEEIRDGLATATQFTNKFTHAQKILSTAQDLARAKNISLEKATSIVGKAYQGNTKGLKNFGIEVGKNVKGTKVLTAVNKSFGGSAKAFAETTEGRMTILFESVKRAGEGIATSLLPIFEELMDVFMKHGLPIIDGVSKAISGFITENKELIKSVITTAVGFVQNLLPVLQKVGEFIFGTVVPAIVGFVQGLTAPGGVTDSIGKVVGGIAKDLVPIIQSFIGNVVKLAGKIGELVGVLWGDGNGPLAIAFKGIAGVAGVLLNIFGNIAGFIGNAISAVIDLGKAIMDSPIGFIIKAVSGFVGNVAGGLGDALSGRPTGGGISTAAPTGYGANNGQFEVKTAVNIDGKQVAESVSKRLNLTPSAAPRGSY